VLHIYIYIYDISRLRVNKIPHSILSCLLLAHTLLILLDVACVFLALFL